MFDDESYDDGSAYKSYGTCDFYFCFDESVGPVVESVGCASGLGYGVSVITNFIYIYKCIFCICFYKIWREKIYNIIRKLRDYNDIKWLRTRMSYHRFPKSGELLQGDLVSKIRRNLATKDFLDRECNCNTTTKVKSRCAYGGECRRCCVICKVTCKRCGEFYVGNTQNTLKNYGKTLPRRRAKSSK